MKRGMCSTSSSVSNWIITILVLFMCTGCKPFSQRPSGFLVWQTYPGEPLQRKELALLILDDDFMIDELDGIKRSFEGQLTSSPSGFPFVSVSSETYAVVELKPDGYILKAKLNYGGGGVMKLGDPVTFQYTFYAGHIYQAYTEEYSAYSLPGQSMWRPVIEDVTDKPAGQKWLKEFENCEYKRIPINGHPTGRKYQTGSIY